MAKSIAFDISGGLATKLSSLALFRIGLWWNFKDDTKDLKSTISTERAVLLDAEEQSMISNLVKNWLEKPKDAFYDNKLMKEVCLFFSSSNQFAYGIKMGHQIKARLTCIGSKAKMFNLVEHERPMETSFMTKKRQQMHSFVSKDEIIGREDDKATLPKHGCAFEMFFDVKNIIKFVTNHAPHQNLAMNQLQIQYRENNYGKKYLLQWVSLKKLLIGGAKGSRIIVTSKCQHMAFEQRSRDSTNSAFIEIGKQILERCGGVPLLLEYFRTIVRFYLHLSYDHFSSHLKHCFAYRRLYPKDNKIVVRTLV
ncbi:hypothetical protein ES332_A11G379100v1 [Gossypium tomentosum]|uniref:Disease resistance N-terminal domain-containing protein n=1 Tax=Gossypium tomentosum TaxID=34277 RepID=A0A5D2NJQ7_GOSTO|nr:hypothetical protein ES332_A11G379100v1 [Gossypium tomentosum]